MSERTLHPIDYLVILQRRKWWFIATFTVCALIGIALVLLLPPVFRSSALVAVQAPAVSPDLVSTGLDREERLRALSQQLRSPKVLERVAREEGLTAERPVGEVTQEMVGRIGVDLPKPITRSEGDQELSAFEIVYRDGSAQAAQRLANRLAQVFVDEHSRGKVTQAEETAEFLGGQLRASQERITKLEARLRSIKELHMGRLPEQTSANLETLSGIRQQLETTSNGLRSEQDRLSLIERQMQSMRQGLYSAPLGSAAGMASPQQRVVTLQRELAAARSQYTDKHPEVQLLEEELKSARAQVTAGQQPDSPRQELLAADPMYQQLVAERSLTQLRIRGLQRAEGQLRADIGRYQQAIEAAPMVEQELASTQREYTFEQENYKTLSQKHQTALVQEQIARTHGGERFSVLNQAYLPESPESPNRMRLMLVALALGLALGAGAAFGREYLDRSIRDARSLQDEFDVPVLAEIPRIHRAA